MHLCFNKGPNSNSGVFFFSQKHNSLVNKRHFHKNDNIKLSNTQGSKYYSKIYQDLIAHSPINSPVFHYFNIPLKIFWANKKLDF